MSGVAVIDAYELSDRYRLDEGRAFISGCQALARLPYEQLRADRRAGLHTAAYISGYQGSPLGGYDRDVTAAAKLATADGLRMVFQPGMNEELAATAVMGSQLAVTIDSCEYEGILGVWYGKAPGVDRASDALRHAVFAGTSHKGGAIALVGDDPTAKSSTLPSSSGATLVDLNMPIIYPGDVQETIDLGRHAVAMSRACGVWVSIKIVDAVADGTGSVELHPERFEPQIPTMEVNGKVWVPRPTGNIITPYTVEIEREFHEVRLQLAQQYGALNKLNVVEVRGPHDWVGIVASGHTYRETLEALRLLGFRNDDELRSAGIRLMRLGLPMPLDPAVVREFALGLAEVIVVEEKGQNLEWVVKDALYGRADAPTVYGKRTPDDQPLFPFSGAMEADKIAPHLRSRLAGRLAERMTPPPEAPRQLIPLSVSRSPYFCSGCPHSQSTKVADGTLVGAGIGCHSMVMLMEPGRAGDVVGITAMGNEGAQWFGMAPFVGDRHLMQNLGDGTLFHSGMGAIRAAIANGANITYKILYNGAVSMTGGQDPFGQLDVLSLCKVLQAAGAKQIIITTDELANYRLADVPAGIKVWGRDRLLEAQEVLAAVPGCTVLIHDQRCAAEKRRDRKRSKIATPDFRVVINERVCEGCGDCGDKSNCLSVQPIDTPFGRKTAIDQNTCNFDFSCMKGDCPAFMTVTATSRRGTESPDRPLPTAPAQLPAPLAASSGPDCTIRLAGIGGTGVVTVSQILGMAAMLQGLHVRGLDQTGLSQKAGPVVSDVRISTHEPAASNKATAGAVDVLIAFDQLVGGADATMRTLSADHTIAVVNAAAVPTGSMVVHPERPYPVGEVTARLDSAARRVVRVQAQRLAVGLLGDDSTANVLQLGVAAQAGLLPVTTEQIERAITLNGTAVAKNLAAFAWGRAWQADPTATEAAAGLTATDAASAAAADTPLRERLAADLRGYQSQRYAARYSAVVDRVQALGHDELTDAVARHLHKLMAYKDEYEVARLLLLPESKAQAQSVGGKRTKVTWLLHPPALRAVGVKNKMHFGRWSRPVFMGLRALHKIRGTPIDVFGWAGVRKVERAMVPEYVAAIEALVGHVAANPDSPEVVAEAVAIASLPDKVRGYEHLKLERAEAYRAELSRRLAALTGKVAAPAQ
ncbi:MAG: indolepyruvate ferredoxin oxidoreductase family protein [Actinomycetota bacterium]|nr:indolepyruvate ferredoxin oxidoreductase family protein [Actinomycetota bacterium]